MTYYAIVRVPNRLLKKPVIPTKNFKESRNPEGYC